MLRGSWGSHHPSHKSKPQIQAKLIHTMDFLCVVSALVLFFPSVFFSGFGSRGCFFSDFSECGVLEVNKIRLDFGAFLWGIAFLPVMGFLGVSGGRPDLAFWVYRPNNYWDCLSAARTLMGIPSAGGRLFLRQDAPWWVCLVFDFPLKPQNRGTLKERDQPL